MSIRCSGVVCMGVACVRTDQTFENSAPTSEAYTRLFNHRTLESEEHWKEGAQEQELSLHNRTRNTRTTAHLFAVIALNRSTYRTEWTVIAGGAGGSRRTAAHRASQGFSVSRYRLRTVPRVDSVPLE